MKGSHIEPHDLISILFCGISKIGGKLSPAGNVIFTTKEGEEIYLQKDGFITKIDIETGQIVFKHYGKEYTLTVSTRRIKLQVKTSEVKGFPLTDVELVETLEVR